MDKKVCDGICLSPLPDVEVGGSKDDMVEILNYTEMENCIVSRGLQMLPNFKYYNVLCTYVHKLSLHSNLKAACKNEANV